MSKIEIAVQAIKEFCENPEHGYAQDADKRWGPDGDCSSYTIMAWEKAGVPVKKAGATYTGNMRKAFLSCGFVDVTSQIELATGAGLQAGDVCLRDPGHVAMYVGDGKIAQAQSNELGKKTGGKTGDQTGNEMAIKPYYNSGSGWKIIMRYAVADVESVPAPLFTLQRKLRPADPNMTGADVLAVEKALLLKGYDPNITVKEINSGIGSYGDGMERAVRAMQTDHPELGTNGKPDGIIGKMSAAFLGGQYIG